MRSLWRWAGRLTGAAALLLVGGCSVASEERPPQATAGSLDLTRWSFAQQGPAHLDGEWDFQLAEVPSAGGHCRVPGPWSTPWDPRFPQEGVATYRLRVALARPERDLALRVGDVTSAYRLTGDELLALEFFICGALLIIGLYHLVLHALRKKEPTVLCFGVLALIVALRTLFSGERFGFQLVPSLPFWLVDRIDYFTAAICPVLFLHFIGGLYPQELRRPFCTWFLAVGSLLTLVLTVSPTRSASCRS